MLNVLDHSAQNRKDSVQQEELVLVLSQLLLLNFVSSKNVPLILKTPWMCAQISVLSILAIAYVLPFFEIGFSTSKRLFIFKETIAKNVKLEQKLLIFAESSSPC